MQSSRSFKSYWLPKLTVAAAIVSAAALLSVSGIGCPIRFLFGIPCPGCGTTRACAAALHGDFAEAFRWHPLFIVAVPAFIYIALGDYPLFGSVRRETVFCVALGLAFLAVYLIRILFSEKFGLYDIDCERGLVIELIHKIFEEWFT